MDMPIPAGSGTGTLSINTNHLYTTTGRITPTLTLVGNDGATTIVTDTTASTPTLLISSTPPTVTLTFSTATNILKAVFSEDVGVELVGQVNGSDAPLGDNLWSDGATTAGSFANDLDIRNDNSGGNISLAGDTFSYNASDFTATWNLSSLTTALNTSSTSYTARLFADSITNEAGTGIQDQAGNALDGIGSGIGGEDASAHFGSAYTVPTVTLATGGVWNTSMPLVFAPSIVPNDIQSLATTTISGVSSTIITFTGNAANEKILDGLIIGGFAGGSVIMEDMATGYTALDGVWTVNKVTATATTDTVTIEANSVSLSDSSWVAGSSGSMHISPDVETTVDNSSSFNIEGELIAALKQITGATTIPMTGKVVSSGIYVGQTPQFDTNTVTDPTGYAKSFDNEAELGQTGYIVNSIGSDLIVAGGGIAGEQDAIDAFLQSLGMQEYGPTNTFYTSSNSIAANIWQVTPSLPTLSGSWDIRQVPGIGYLNDNNDDGGNYSENYGWDSLYLFNYGQGSPAPAGGTGALATQAANLGLFPSQALLDNNPDWWASGTNTTLSGLTYAATFMPLGTVSVGNTFSVTLKSGATAQTVTVTANASDDTPGGIVTAMDAAIAADVTDTFFESTSIVVKTNNDYNTNGPLTLSSTTNPVVEIYDKTGSIPAYTVSSSTNSSGATFPSDVYHDSQLNYTNPGVYNYVLNAYVAPWVSTAASGALLSLSSKDGPGYDQSQSTIDAMHSNNPYQVGDTAFDWQGYNQNGVLVDAVSESYWNLVNELAQYVLQNEGSRILFVGGLAYASTSQPPSFAMEPNVLIESGQLFQNTPDTIDEQMKINSNHGALVGDYVNWGIYLETGYNNPDAPDFQPSNVENHFALYNDDHVLVLEGESAASYGADSPGVLLAGLLTDNPTTSNATTVQTVLTNYYTGLFGPAAVNMEDYNVLFNGSAADPNLASPPAQVTFDGLAFGAFGEPVGTYGQPNTTPPFNVVVSDNLALQQSFGYLDAADTSLANAYNNGHNASFTTTQYNTYQARVDQFRMYNQFLFYEYKVESDYFGLANKTPAINSANFNLILGDLDNVAIWVNDLVSTNLIAADNIDGTGGFDVYTYASAELFLVPRS